MMRVLIYSLTLLLTAAFAAPALDLEEQLSFADGLYARGMYELAAREYGAVLEAFPENPHLARIHFRRGESYRHIGERVAADRDYRRVFAEFPDSEFRHRAGYRRADLFMDAGQPQAAIDLYKAVLDAKPPDDIGAACLYFLAEAYRENDDADAAKAAYRRLRKTCPESAFDAYALLRLGGLHADAFDDTGQALTDYEQAVESADTDRIAAEALFRIAEIHFDRNKYEQSAKAYGKLISGYPADRRTAEARLKAGWAAHYAGRYAEALQYVGAALADEAVAAGPEWYYLKANCERQLVRYEDAVQTYRDLADRFAASDFAPAARYELALTYFKMGRFEDAVETASRVDVSGDLGRDVYWLLAESHAALDNEDDAIQYYGLVARKFPDSDLAADSAYRRAHLLQSRGDLLEASRGFGNVAAEYPDSDVAPRALFASGFCLQKLGQHEEAARDWARLAERYPKHKLVEEAIYQRGVSELRLRRHADAGETFRKLIETHPTSRFRSDALYWRGMVLREMGQSADAVDALRRALKAKPRRELRREIEFGLALALLDSAKRDEAADLLVALVETPTREKFTPPLIEWLGGYLLANGKHDAAVRVSRMLIKEDAAPRWVQTGWCLVGRAEMNRGAEAAADAFRKALAVDVETAFAAEAALYLGDLAATDGSADEARRYYERAAAMASADAQLSVRAHAYAGLGRVALGAEDMADAARYFMSVAILYDDPELVPECLGGAVEAFKALGQDPDAREAAQELRERYPDSPQAAALSAATDDAGEEAVP